MNRLKKQTSSIVITSITRHSPATTPNIARINIDPDSRFAAANKRRLDSSTRKSHLQLRQEGFGSLLSRPPRQTNPNPFPWSMEQKTTGSQWSFSRILSKRAWFGKGSPRMVLRPVYACPACTHARTRWCTQWTTEPGTRVQLSKHRHERNIRGIALSLRVCPLLR